MPGGGHVLRAETRFSRQTEEGRVVDAHHGIDHTAAQRIDCRFVVLKVDEFECFNPRCTGPVSAVCR